jgi:hypothetical protein
MSDPIFTFTSTNAGVAASTSSEESADAGIYLTTATGAIYRWNPATKSTRLMAETGLALTDIAFHPDGRMFAITATSLYQIDLASGNPTLVGTLRSDSELYFGVNQLTDANGFDISPEGIGRISSGNNTIIVHVNLETGQVANYAGPVLSGGVFTAGDIWFEGAAYYVTTTNSTLVKAVVSSPNGDVLPGREISADVVWFGNNQVDGLVGMPAGVDGVLPGTLVGFSGNTAYLLGAEQPPAFGPGYATLPVNGSITGATMQRGVTVDPNVPDNNRVPIPTDDNIIVAALNLSARAYSDTHLKDDQLIIDKVNAEIKSWIPLEVDASSFTGSFTLVGNEEGGNLLRYVNSNASATVGLTILDGKITLGIAFEGTNTTSSATTILPFPSANAVQDWIDNLLGISLYYNKLAGFNAAIVQWIEDHNIERVLVTGHSLGGAAAQIFMQEYGMVDEKFFGVTFGSPGTNSSQELPKDRFVNIKHNSDGAIILGSERGYKVEGSIINVLIDGLSPIQEHSLFDLSDSATSYRKSVEFITSQLDAGLLFRDLNIVPGSHEDDNLNARIGKNGEVILGGRGDDILIAGLVGGLNTQIFKGGPGNNFIDGGGGVDYALYDGSRASYRVERDRDAPDQWVITDQRLAPSNDGTDTLKNIERIIFSDTALAVDVDGAVGKVAKLLGAIFSPNSISNPEYVAIGLSELDKGTKYEDLAAFAIAAAGASAPEQVTSLLWNNVVGSAPTNDEIQPFVSMLNSGTSRGELGVLAAEHELNLANIDLVGLRDQGVIFDPLGFVS